MQAAAVIVAPVVLTVVIVARISEQAESYITWGCSRRLVISGFTTALQARRLGRIGAGHVLIMGTSGAFIAVCVAALVRGGPATMASLVVVSSLFQFLMANRLSWLRRVFTPVVAGTVITRLEGLLRELAAKSRWDPALAERLVLVGEETLSSRLAEEEDSPAEPRHLVVTARSAAGGVELEFLCGSDRENLEDRLSYVGDAPEIPDARELSFRLLRHYASSVRHQKYHDVDIVTINVAGPR